jgi:hypothetical protein
MMINMIVTIFGLLLVIVGFYLMYLGFLTPPSPLAFFLGLIMTVLGMIIIILFGSSMQLSKGSSAPKQKASPKTARTEALKGLTVSKTNEKEKTPAKPIKRKVPPIRPRPAPNNKTDASTTPPIAEPEKEEVKPQEKEEVKPKETTKPPEPVKKAPKVEKIETPPKVEEAEDKSKRKPVKPQIKGVTDAEVKDDAYVKNRLERLKDDYILNAKDIETLVDERLDSFKGTLNRLKTETTDPSIIWSFEAQDVQGALKDTISQAENRILMMYPWVRNIEVSVLKKFMDTESKMIIQEASLDDDTSVELIKLLLENNVQIRTMPHVHTVAVVADDNNGLIISTDPIYESYEVGVVYRDQKSIQEIEHMFEDAWNLSKEMNLEIKG